MTKYYYKSKEIEMKKEKQISSIADFYSWDSIRFIVKNNL